MPERSRFESVLQPKHQIEPLLGWCALAKHEPYRSSSYFLDRTRTDSILFAGVLNPGLSKSAFGAPSACVNRSRTNSWIDRQNRKVIPVYAGRNAAPQVDKRSQRA